MSSEILFHPFAISHIYLFRFFLYFSFNSIQEHFTEIVQSYLVHNFSNLCAKCKQQPAPSKSEWCALLAMSKMVSDKDCIDGEIEMHTRTHIECLVHGTWLYTHLYPISHIPNTQYTIYIIKCVTLHLFWSFCLHFVFKKLNKSVRFIVNIILIKIK